MHTTGRRSQQGRLGPDGVCRAPVSEVVAPVREVVERRQAVAGRLLGVNTEGHKELLGMWLSENEGAKFWLGILTELKNRGLDDILIACML